jgi:hypothetical protein
VLAGLDTGYPQVVCGIVQVHLVLLTTQAGQTGPSIACPIHAAAHLAHNHSIHNVHYLSTSITNRLINRHLDYEFLYIKNQRAAAQALRNAAICH